MSTYRLKNLLSPRLVALVGVSPRQASVGLAILRNIQKTNFRGEFGLVNAHYQEIDGVGSVGRLGELPFVPELVVVTAPARAVAGLIEGQDSGVRPALSSFPPGSATVRDRWQKQPSAPRRSRSLRRDTGTRKRLKAVEAIRRSSPQSSVCIHRATKPFKLARQRHQHYEDHSEQTDILHRRQKEGDLNFPIRLLAFCDRNDIRDDENASQIGGCKDRGKQRQ
jgi:hypothetical protein